jgi:hypothetical protein
MTNPVKSKQQKQKQQYPFERFASIRRYHDFDFLKKIMTGWYTFQI